MGQNSAAATLTRYVEQRAAVQRRPDILSEQIDEAK